MDFESPWRLARAIYWVAGLTFVASWKPGNVPSVLIFASCGPPAPHRGFSNRGIDRRSLISRSGADVAVMEVGNASVTSS